MPEETESNDSEVVRIENENGQRESHRKDTKSKCWWNNKREDYGRSKGTPISKIAKR